MEQPDRSRFALSLGVAAALLAACGGSQPPIGAPDATTVSGDSLPYHHTFNYTGSEQSFKVPAGVRSITVVARGAAGTGKPPSYGHDFFGRGGRVYAVISVRPGETLHVFVGGQGTEAIGGFNGGGDGGASKDFSYDRGYGGGGGSDVREHGSLLSDRILVAGGGGGEGNGRGSGDGGEGGGKIGGDGGDAYFYYAGGGKGGTQNAGGSGGAGGPGSDGPGHAGSPGRLGRGGKGGRGGINRHAYSGEGGGGGGGGYCGGGGGGGGEAGEASLYGRPGGGGGGGSSYVEPSAINVHMWRGWKNAISNGLVVFSWK